MTCAVDWDPVSTVESAHQLVKHNTFCHLNYVMLEVLSALFEELHPNRQLVG
jgi:hypothetical protein